jgi:hypothetical protein
LKYVFPRVAALNHSGVPSGFIIFHDRFAAKICSGHKAA